MQRSFVFSCETQDGQKEEGKERQAIYVGGEKRRERETALKYVRVMCCFTLTRFTTSMVILSALQRQTQEKNVKYYGSLFPTYTNNT